MLRAATKLTSTVKKSNGPGSRCSDSVFQSVCSWLSTRGSAAQPRVQLPLPHVDRGDVGRALLAAAPR